MIQMSDLKRLREELQAVERLIESGEGNEMELVNMWSRLISRMDSVERVEL